MNRQILQVMKCHKLLVEGLDTFMEGVRDGTDPEGITELKQALELLFRRFLDVCDEIEKDRSEFLKQGGIENGKTQAWASTRPG